jgi:hypothetical protein
MVSLSNREDERAADETSWFDRLTMRFTGVVTI